jgi:mono/diheme cytochrome c family protein
MKRVVDVVEIVALVCAAIFVVMLFANEPATSSSTSTAGGSVDGAAIFATYCSACHGADGGGGRGPQLSDGHVVDHFANAADEIDVVTNGRGGMPAWKDRLTDEEIAAVVAYTRTL